MPKFVKKPIEIEAFQYKGNADELLDWISQNHGAAYANHEGFFISTLEGLMEVSFDDWVIKGIKDEFYPCKPDIFEMTYTTTALELCQNCNFCDTEIMDDDSSVYSCHRHAPHGIAGINRTLWDWPRVDSWDWCGEWERVEE
jgi:hypothetical protein